MPVPETLSDAPRAADFAGYAIDGFFDEMFTADGTLRPHYRKFAASFQTVPREEWETRRHSVDALFLRQGITFNVYGDSKGTERIFPFDLMPRIISAAEWEKLEAGLVQRITALNLFLHDIYHEQRILKDGTIPPHYVLSGKHFRREFVNFAVPKDIYIHVCGTDLIRDDQGNYLVLEDNARCPSEVSYVLENRRAMKRTFRNVFEKTGVRPVEHYPQELLKALRHIAPAGIALPRGVAAWLPLADPWTFAADPLQSRVLFFPVIGRLRRGVTAAAAQRQVPEIVPPAGAEDDEAQVHAERRGEQHPQRRVGGNQRQAGQLRAAGEHEQRHAQRLRDGEVALHHGHASHQAPGGDAQRRRRHVAGTAAELGMGGVGAQLL